jgi:tRNA threonylcarbamoyladenosine biosynthesis protein TsaB
MSRIILIETSTSLCSVALSENGAITSYRESSAPKAHASLTAVFVQEVLAERNLTLADCDAVCVSKGPGSYTGLRVGVSTAKGLCFGSKKPLIAVGTLDTLVAQSLYHPERNCHPEHTCHPERSEGSPYRFIIPMIDARRMEVYTAVFSPCHPEHTCHPEHSEGSPSYRQQTETAPAIIDETSFAEYLEQGPCLFIGDGAGKCADVIKHPNAHFCQCHPNAASMLAPAMEALNSNRFEDVAYFEPFYLKEFVATVSKKKLF